MNRHASIFILLALTPVWHTSTAEPLPQLRVSEDGRRLEHGNGTPFFWLGDTTWQIIRKSTLEESPSQPSVRRYFETRSALGFNVLQTALNAGALGSSNAYGHAAFVDGDLTRPRLIDGPDNDYWDYVDTIVNLAADHGLYLALLPWWQQSIADDHPFMQDPAIAYEHYRWLGARYRRQTNILWVLGGDPKPDRNESHPARLRMIRAQAEGLADGINGENRFDGLADYGTWLFSYHPGGGGRSSADYLHNEPWLDFNLIQTTTRFNFDNWRTVATSFWQSPPKPVLDSEVAYEDSLPLDGQEKEERPGEKTSAWEVRRAAYWNVLAGGFGHTYGHRSFISWTLRGEINHNGADTPWFERLDAPGAVQMGHLRRLIESLPTPHRLPDQSLLLGRIGSGSSRCQPMRAYDRSYAMVYSPEGRPFTFKMAALKGGSVAGFWFNPRSGKWSFGAGTEESDHPVPFVRDLPVGEGSTEQRFEPPGRAGPGNDWVLVLRNANVTAN